MIKQYLNRRLTGLQMASALIAVAALAGLGYLGYNFAVAILFQARVNAALPKVSDAIRQQRGDLLKAIEAYKAHFGVYPPDHVLSRQPLVVDPVTNTLLYELVGVVYNPTNKLCQIPHLEEADAKYVKDFFQCDGFRNSAESADKVKHFLNIDPPPVRQFHDDPDVYALSFQVPYEGLRPDVVWEFEPGTWRYISSAPTNNPGKFDLWIELRTKKRKIVIGNWKAAE